MPENLYYGPPVVLSVHKPKPPPVVVAKKPTTPGATAGSFDINPAPQSGQGAYGSVPGPIAYPPTPYEEATRLYPGLKNIEPTVFDQIQSQVHGDFTPSEENALWDISNRYGVQSGMPGAGLWSNRFMGNVVDARQKRIQQGIGNYTALLEQYSKLGMDPNLAASLAARNATMGSAPNPELATRALETAYRNAQANPGGGTLRNTVGQGNYDPAWAFRNSPASGTVATTPTPKPTYPNPFTPAPAATTNPNAVAQTSSRTEEDLFNEWMDYIDPASSGGYQEPYQDPYLNSPQWNSDMDYITGMSNDPGYTFDTNYNSGTVNDFISGLPFTPSNGGASPYDGYFMNQADPFALSQGQDWSSAPTVDPFANLDQTDGYENMDYLSDPWAFYG